MEDGDIQSIGTGPATLSPHTGPVGFGSIPAPAEPLSTTEDVIILEPGQEQAQKFIKAISHQNASDVLQLLRETGPVRLSDIAERLGMSLNATKYHVENLMDAGLLEISNTRYSVKGRKVKMYRMKNQIFIVAPTLTEKKQIISAVLKYGSFLGVYLLVAITCIAALPLSGLVGTLPLTGALQPGVLPETIGLTGFIESCVVGLLLAAIITMMILVVYQVAVHYRTKNPQDTI